MSHVELLGQSPIASDRQARPLSPATRAGDFVFVSGQVPVAPDGSVPPTLAEQADQVYANIVAVLAAKGIPPQNIIKLTTFFVEENDPGALVAAARRTREELLGRTERAYAEWYGAELAAGRARLALVPKLTSQGGAFARSARSRERAPGGGG